MDKQKVFKLLMEAIHEIDLTACEVTIRYHQPPEGGIGDTFEINIPANSSFKGKTHEWLVYADLFKEVL